MRDMRTFGGFVAALIVATVGCGDAAAKGASAGAKPPAELLASVSRGPATGLDGLRAFADAMKPGTGGMLTDALVSMELAQVVGAKSLAGFDRASPSYVLYVDGGGVKGLAVAGKVADAKALADGAGSAFVASKNGWAVIGPKPVVDKVSAYALSSLAALPDVATPTATFYVPHVLGRYHAELQAARAQVATAGTGAGAQMAGFMTAYVDGFVSVLGDSDQLVVTIDASKDGGALDLTLVPKAGTKLAKFVAAQKPTDYALVDKLGDAGGPMLFAGHLEGGPYRKDLIDLSAKMYGPSTPKDLIAFIDTLMKSSTGEVAMSMDLAPGKGMSMTYLFGLADHKAADGAITKMLALFDKGMTSTVMGMKMTLKTVPGSTEHDGVTLRAYEGTYDLSTVPAASKAAMQSMMSGGAVRTQLATFDDLGLATLGPDSEAAAGRAIDAARGKGTHHGVAKDVAATLAASARRKDSVAMMFDLGGFAAMMGTPAKLNGKLVMSAGFADGAAHLRMEMPTSMFRGMQKGTP